MIHKDIIRKLSVSVGFLLVLTGGVVSYGYTERPVSIKSPDKKIDLKFFLSSDGEPHYVVFYRDRKVIDTSALGILLKGKNESGETMDIADVAYTSVTSDWRPLYGEREEYPNHYNQMTVTLRRSKETYPTFQMVFRCYNEGVAFKYLFMSKSSRQEHVISEDRTTFSLPKSATAWVSYTAQGKIEEIAVDRIAQRCERPLLIKEDDSNYVAIGEAALVDFARMKLVRTPGKRNSLSASLDGEVKEHGDFFTPWRYIMISSEPGKLVENNYLLLNLNDPGQLPATPWIRPGKVIREITLTTQGGLACVNFAAKHNMQYVEFDAGWYGAENSDTSDATRVSVDPARSKGPLDLHKVIEYGKQNGIGIILYVNRKALERQLDTILPLYESWGVKGVKFGFVRVGSQEANAWLMMAVRKAAQHHLMVDIHDEFRPTGYSRTYPNLMTQEGIRGDEESPSNEMVLKTLFTRMIAGAADQTNCYFSSRVDKMGSHASQLAKSVCIYSPFQFLFWYDRQAGSPNDTGGGGGVNSIIKETSELKFFDDLPVVWDDTKVLSGYPGEYIIMARRRGTDWFVACLNGAGERNFEIPLNFLDKGVTYQAILYSDDPEMDTQTKVGTEKMEVNRDNVLNRIVLPQNGIVLKISPQKSN